MGRFVADPPTLRRNSNKIKQNAAEFRTNYEKIYSLKNNLFTRGFVAPEAKAISNLMDSFRDDLTTMQRIINDYGSFLETAANKVNRTQNNIIDEVS